MSPGVYFHSALQEIRAVGLLQDDVLPDEDGWAKVSDDPRLGLLAVRQLLVEQGLASDPRRVDWYGTRARDRDRAA